MVGGQVRDGRKVRAHIENVLSWAQAKGFIPERLNVARWQGNIEHAQPKRPESSKSKNHAALPYADVPALMSAFRDNATMGSLALQFIVLTAVRLNEARQATWGEFDLDARLWTIGSERMKMDRPHQVPLSDAAIAILREVRRLYGESGPERHSIVFVGERAGGECGTINKTLKGINRDVTVHGFRSSFRDWCGDETDFHREVAEAALAHIVSGVEGDYRRGTALAKRRELMQAWADFAVGTPRGEVIALRA